MRLIRKFRYLLATLFVIGSCRTATFQSTAETRPEVKVVKPPVQTPTAKTKNQARPVDPKTDSPSPDNTSPPLSPEPTGTAKTEDVTETFLQAGQTGPADILIVIDNSDSMTEEQKNLSSKLGDLLAELKDSNWQIGVITTSVLVKNDLDSCKLTLIQPSDSQYEEKFRKAVTPGVTGAALEEGIRQAVNGLRCPETPWIRPNATVAVLIVSDEDNCSNGLGCRLQPSNTEQYLIDYVERDMGRVVGSNAGFYGIFSPPATPCRTATNKANQYQKLVNYNANGKVNYGNICDVSYKDTLQRISKNISILLTNQFSLKQKPDAGSVSVKGKKSDGSALTSTDFKVIGSTLSFVDGHEPSLQTEFEVTYTVTTGP